MINYFEKKKKLTEGLGGEKQSWMDSASNLEK